MNAAGSGNALHKNGAYEPDESGRRRPIEIKGSEFDLECDTVIMSLGTSPTHFLPQQPKD